MATPDDCGWDHRRFPDAPSDHDGCTGGPEPSRPDPGRPEHQPGRGGYPSGDRRASHLPPPSTGVKPPSPFELAAMFPDSAAALSPLLASATALHELYQSFVEAGFDRDQAMQLVSAFVFHALDADSGP